MIDFSKEFYTNEAIKKLVSKEAYKNLEILYNMNNLKSIFKDISKKFSKCLSKEITKFKKF
jgi:hypothetical protein